MSIAHPYEQDGWLPLHIAVGTACRSEEVIAKLLEVYPEAVNVQTTVRARAWTSTQANMVMAGAYENAMLVSHEQVGYAPIDVARGQSEVQRNITGLLAKTRKEITPARV